MHDTQLIHTIESTNRRRIMKHRHLIPALLVALVGIMTVGCWVGSSEGEPTAVESKEPPVATTPEPAEVTAQPEPTTTDDSFSPYVDKAGKISLPSDYKVKWPHIGSWAVAKKEGKPIHEMHDVYTQPETIAAFQKTGEFPDGAVLVKEVHNAQADGLTTGHAAWSTDIKIWFVMIKDRKERFKDSDDWGDGWGWALFEAKDRSKNVSAGYDSSCISCHVPVEDTDWVYTYGYPTLKKNNE
jgi:hypothetical protein